jgi:putative oxidoreductase
MANLSNPAALVGRILMSIIFILGGIEKLSGFSGTAGYMAHEGLPIPVLATIVAIVVELGGGILVLVGFQTRWAGLLLAVWCIATALVAHTNFGDANQMIHFMKNVTMAGGFLQLFAFGGGAFSVDGRSKRAA